jgi:peptidylprolyl isomerase
MRTKLIILTILMTLSLAACGEDDEPAAGGGTTTTEETTPEPAPTDDDPVEVLAEGISEDLDEKPTVPMPQGEPPAELVMEDIVKGKGRAAKAGNDVSVQYVGVSWSTGQEFDASWNTGQPFPFPLGAGRVIPGWDEGVVGMKKGGRRLLVIPPELGYGAAGSPPVIAPNETLVFVVDMVDPKA